MNLKYYIAIILLVASLGTRGQQGEVPNQSFQDFYVINPAAAGMNSAFQASLFHRSRWSSIEGAPTTSMLTVSGLLPNQKMGLGLLVGTEQRGLTKNLDARGSYSYRLKLNDEAFLNAGVSVGIFNQSFDMGSAIVLDQNDPMTMNSGQSTTTFDADAGLTLKWSDLELGVSANRLLANRVAYGDAEQDLAFNLERQFLFFGQYAIKVAKEQNVRLFPQVLLGYSVGSPLKVNGGVQLDWQKVGWVGINYNVDYGLNLNAGFRIKEKFRVGYSYDLILAGYNGQAGLSHEIFVGFSLPSKKSAQPPIEIIDERLDSVTANNAVVDTVPEQAPLTPTQQEEADIDRLYDLIDEYFDLTETKESTAKNYDRVVEVHREIDDLLYRVLEEDQKLIRDTIEQHDEEVGFVMPPDDEIKETQDGSGAGNTNNTVLTPEEQEKVDIDRLYDLVDEFFELTANKESEAKNGDKIKQIRDEIEKLLYRVNQEEQQRIRESLDN